MELQETINMMQSEDYKERFKAEYYQLKIRIEKLDEMLIKYKAGTLGFVPKCRYELLIDQCDSMVEYLRILEARAFVEGIEL